MTTPDICGMTVKLFKRLAAFAAVSVSVFSAVAADQTDKSEFAEKIFCFDGAAGKRPLPEPWVQNTHSSFKPFGRAELIPSQARYFKKALRITSTAADTDIYTSAIPVKAGDVLKVEAGFRSPDGKTPVKFGIYGEYQAMLCHPSGKGWDSRYALFVISKPTTKSIRCFVQGPKNATADFSYLSCRKLRPEEIAVQTSAENLKLWNERTRGTNLAGGKKVQFHPAPNFKLTAKGGTDAADLTDGQIYRGSGMLHFQSRAVGWHPFSGQISILIDLGAVKPVAKGVIRLNGGRLKSFSFPKELTIWGSKDGQNFYRGQSMIKLGKLEDYLSNFRDAYYLPEDEENRGLTYVYPFELRLDADVRYVVFQMQPGAYNLFCDEAAVIQADPETVKSPDFNRICKQAPKSIFHENIIVRPKMDKMYIAEGKWLPNLLILDNRKKETGGILTFTIDLPLPVEYRFANLYPAHIRKFVKSEKNGNRTVFHFKSELPVGPDLTRLANSYPFGPMYFMVKDASLLPEKERYVVFSSYCDGKLEKAVKMPLEVLKMPDVPQLKQLEVSLWFTTRYLATWPDFLTAFHSAGLNVFQIFPESLDYAPQLEQFVKQNSNGKNRFRMVLNPLVVSREKDPDFYCQTKGSTKTVCLAYRGPAYQALLARITEYVRKFPCDYLSIDVESWEPHTMNNAMKCPRCNALREKMKMNWVQYFNWAQSQYLMPFRAAVNKGAAAAGRKPPRIGFYALAPGSASFRYSCSEGPVDYLGGFDRMFPAYTDEAQFSYYGRDAAGVHHRARTVYEKLKNPSICIPWISGGTGAYYSEPLSRRTSHHFLEAILNGSGGVQFFSYRSFESPLDYYYLALAVKQIAPFEDLLMEGSLDFDFSGTNKNLLYTRRDWKGKSLILIGNYEAYSEAETTLPLKGKVTDLISGKKQAASGSFQVKIPADDYLLLLVE